MYLQLFFSLVLIHLTCSSITGGKIIGHDASVRKGENISLFCHLTETEENLTRIVWKKQTREKSEQETFLTVEKDGQTQHRNDLLEKVKFIGNITERNGSVQLLGMTPQDDGMYTCIFIFTGGQHQTYIIVTVIDPPQLVVISPDDPAHPQEYLCSVDCNPAPTSYIWTKVDGSTPHSEGNKLFIPELSSDFNGVYICTASNQYGSASGVLYVNNTRPTDDCWLLLGLVFSCAVLWTFWFTNGAVVGNGLIL